MAGQLAREEMEIVLIKGENALDHTCQAAADALSFRAGFRVTILQAKRLRQLGPSAAERLVGRSAIIGFDLKMDDIMEHLCRIGKRITFIHTVIGQSKEKSSILQQNAKLGPVLVEGNSQNSAVTDHILLPAINAGNWDPLNPFRKTKEQAWIAVLSPGVPHSMCRKLQREFLAVNKRSFVLGIFKPAEDIKDMAIRFENLSAYYQPDHASCSWSFELSSALLAGVPVFSPSAPPELAEFVHARSLDEIEAMLPYIEQHCHCAASIQKKTERSFVDKIVHFLSESEIERRSVGKA